MLRMDPSTLKPRAFAKGYRVLFGDQAMFVRAVDFRYVGGVRSSITLVPIRPRSRGERRSSRTFAVVSLRPGSLAFNPDTPRRLSTPLLTPFNSTPTFVASHGTFDPQFDESLPIMEDADLCERMHQAGRHINAQEGLTRKEVGEDAGGGAGASSGGSRATGNGRVFEDCLPIRRPTPIARRDAFPS